MKIAAPVLVVALCAASMHVRAVEPKSASITAAEQQASATYRMSTLFKRKQEKEDPANPVAAAATDPNEAAMKIKSRDLIPTDRPGARPAIHQHQHPHHADEDDADSDDTDAKLSSTPSKRKPATKNKSNDRDKEEEDEEADDDSDSVKGKQQQPKKGNSAGKPKPKSDKGDKDEDKKGKKDVKGKKDAKGKKDKNTHTGLDGNEVDDEEADDAEAARKKKVQVQHVKAQRRKWRTGKPKYNYNQALAGWKEVGPLYYYKGKYENAAVSVRASYGPVAVAIAAVALA
ncbi:hypothetical protein GGH96_001887 [Coemansia sp. RSA 1972]|nr:hypothetical protein GGH96_001887 [Coemansia sp. RSA 1972]